MPNHQSIVAAWPHLYRSIGYCESVESVSVHSSQVTRLLFVNSPCVGNTDSLLSATHQQQILLLMQGSLLTVDLKDTVCKAFKLKLWRWGAL